MKSHRITGGGGIRLHLMETGKPGGRPIMFLHGFAQSWHNWSCQMKSDLADDHRLVAMDLRGHGLSEKPREGYTDSRLWADDVNAAIQSLRLDHPILSGWSYGPLVILDYIRHYGEDSISGVNFVGGITKLGSEAAMSVLTPGFLSLVPGLLSADAQESARSLESLLRLCFARQPSAEELRLMLERSVSVPSYVRQALFSRSFDNDDLLPKVRKPVLICQGGHDAVVKLAAVDQHKAAMTHAQVQVMDTGHACFWDDPAGFNRHLRAFSEASLVAR